MIRIFTTGREGERFINLCDVNIITQKICEWTSVPYIIFEHEDYPLGGLRAEYKNNVWECDLD